MTDFQRARQPDQKAKRRAHVLATAREILADGAVDLGQLTLNELARRVGMAKSNLYRYFETRSHMATSYRRPARGRPALDALVRHLARTLAAGRLLCALTTALPSVLERNLSEDAIRAVKTRSLQSFREIGAFLTSKVPDLSAEQYSQLLSDGVVVVAGLYPIAFPSRPAARVVAAPELALFRRDLSRDLERFLLALARDRVAGQLR